MSRRTVSDYRARISQGTRDLLGLVSRVVFGASEGGQWEALGYETDDDEQGGLADVFQGAGIYARPTSGGEGVVVQVGGAANHPVVAAVRDETARQAFVAAFGRDLAAGETAIFSGAGNAYVVLTASGDVQIEVPSGQKIYARTTGGLADALVTKTEHNLHVHAGAGITPTVPATGTVVLEAQ